MPTGPSHAGGKAEGDSIRMWQCVKQPENLIKHALQIVFVRCAFLKALVRIGLFAGAASAATAVDSLDAVTISELHFAIAESWLWIDSLTLQLHEAGALGPPSTSTGGAPESGQDPRTVSPALLQELSQLQKELTELQTHASRMAEESSPSADAALLESKAMMKYIQDLQHFKHRLDSCVISFEAAYKQILGRIPRRSGTRKGRRKDATGLGGMSIEERVQRAREEVVADGRAFRAKAVDIVSSFHERQLAMRDMQRELQVFLARGTSESEYALTTADARVLSARENVIQQALANIVTRLGGREQLVRIPEDGDEEVLVQLAATRDLMVEYCKDVKRQLARWTGSLKALPNHRPRRPRRPRRPKDSGSESLVRGLQSGETLTENLRSFGSSEPGSLRPFAWLRTDGEKIEVASKGPSFRPADLDEPTAKTDAGISGTFNRQQPLNDPKWSWAEPIYDPGDSFASQDSSSSEL